MSELAELETRISKLPDSVRDRFRKDPSIRSTLAKLEELTQKLSTGEIDKSDLTALEDLQAEVAGTWVPCLQQVEIDSKISSPTSEVPVCLYCGTGFGLEGVPEPIQWTRLRKHVERLHKTEWTVAASKP